MKKFPELFRLFLVFFMIFTELAKERLFFFVARVAAGTEMCISCRRLRRRQLIAIFSASAKKGLHNANRKYLRDGNEE